MPGIARAAPGGHTGGIRLLPALLASLAAVAVPGCAEERPQGILSDSAYVDVVARLVRVDAMAEAARAERRTFRPESARTAVLEEAGLTRQELRDYALAMGDDPGHMAGIWERIESRVSELERAEAADTTGLEGRPPDTAGLEGRPPDTAGLEEEAADTAGSEDEAADTAAAARGAVEPDSAPADPDSVARVRTSAPAGRSGTR